VYQTISQVPTRVRVFVATLFVFAVCTTALTFVAQAVNSKAEVNDDSTSASSHLATLSAPPLAFVVNDGGDAVDNNIGDSLCDTNGAAGDQCKLALGIGRLNSKPTLLPSCPTL
jgi:hypothetical protein